MVQFLFHFYFENVIRIKIDYKNEYKKKPI
jgi:hypothetical protein